MNLRYSAAFCILAALGLHAQVPCDSLVHAYFTPVQNGTLSVSFTNNSIAPTTPAPTWWWEFGDGGTSPNFDPTHIYQQSGTYTVCLVVTWGNCTSTYCHEMLVGGGTNPCDSLKAAFSASSIGLTGIFANALSSNSYTYHWTFGDGSVGYGADPSHTYSASGAYHVCLIMWAWNPLTQDTCFADHCEWVTVQGGGVPCDSLGHASFTYANNGNLAVAFSNTSFHATGTGTAYLWAFGDGSHSTLFDPSHTYAQSGTYTACLTQYVWILGTSDTCTSTYCHEVHVVGGGTPCDSLGHASFTYANNGNLAVAFSNTSFHAAGTGTAYLWSFGDGSHSTLFDPTHTYPQNGTYTACLTQYVWIIGTTDTCSTTYCHIVHVDGGGGSLCDSLFTVDFTWGPSGTNGVFYSANTTPFAGGWLWHFGDGTSSDAGPQGTHVYGGPGTFELCLTAWYAIPGTSDTCTHTMCHWVIIGGGAPCDSSLSAYFTWETIGLLIHFHDGSTTNGQSVSYSWAFGDGGYSSDQNATHTYSQAGVYHPCLTITTINSLDTCSSTYCHEIHVLIEGIKELGSTGGLIVAPQPFSDMFTLGGQGLEGETRIMLYDALGRLVDDRTVIANGNIALDYSALPPATYVMRVHNGDRDRTVRLMKR